MTTPRIRIGVGGWTYEPWRDNFFPAGLPHAQELHYASRHLTAIEVNGTYYSTMKRASFERWHADTPDDFVFSLKASRYTTNRRVLAEAGDSIQRFVDSGIGALGAKLGPVLWQFMPTKKFDADDFEAFLALLPKSVEGLTLRHVMDVRHASFAVPEYVALARKYAVATVYTDSAEFPSFADLSSDFVYARLMCAAATIPTGYADDALAAIADTARAWRDGAAPPVLPYADAGDMPAVPRDVFVYFINGAKERAPAAAQALIARMDG